MGSDENDSGLANASTTLLIDAIREGDKEAEDILYKRYFYRFLTWARGRLPVQARSSMDTQDLIQETLTRAFRRIPVVDFDTGGFHWYVRAAVMNRIRSLGRLKPRRAELPEEMESPAPSPFEQVVGEELADRYENALGRLRDTDRKCVVLRVELRLDNREIAKEIEKTEDAARMAVHRALTRLAFEMKGIEKGDGQRLS